jgi:arylsulfatase A-like enzyme
VAIALLALASFAIGACSRTATHESGTVTPPEYDELDQQGNASYAATQSHAYQGSWSAKARFEGNTSAESYARGSFDANTAEGRDGYYGAAFYFPVGTFTGAQPSQKGRVDILRWDSQQDDPASDYGGIRIDTDHKARLVRGNFGSGTTQEIGSPFPLEEGCWNWLSVHQKLSNKPSNDPGHAVNEVFLNGYKFVDSAEPNNYSGSGAKQVRVGMPGLDETAQDVPLEFYVDNGHVAAGNGSIVEPKANACKPNVLFIVTDDQRADNTMAVMPKTKKWFFDGGTANGQPVAGGTEFDEAYATTPLCCPARASIMTGRYAHNHNVRDIPPLVPPVGDPNRDSHPLIKLQDSTLQRYMQQRAGYRTGLFGKFLNGWRVSDDPPYWDVSGKMEQNYCPFRIKEKGVPSVLKGHGPAGTAPHQFCQGGPEDYSTDWVAQKAVDFIQDSESNDSQPWFLYLAPFAPHRPALPELDYSVNALPRGQLPSFALTAAHSETDLSDKPDWVQTWTDARQMFEQSVDGQTYEGFRLTQLRTLKSVDDLVDNVMLKVLETGEDRNTLAIFISDNGYQWREHGDASKEQAVDPVTPQAQPPGLGLTGKQKPYLESVKVPMFMRWPGNPNVKRTFVDDSLVANIDMAATAMQAAHIAPNTAAGEPPLDGRPLLSRPITRSRMLTEGWGTDEGVPPPWASIRTPTYHYIEYYAADVDDPSTPGDESKQVVFREFYDLTTDPFEVTNLYPATNPPPATLTSQLAADRECLAARCP